MDVKEAIRRKNEADQPEYEAVTRQTMTTKEVATYLGLSVDFVYKLVRENDIPKIRIGSRILFKKDSIDQWLQNLENHV